MSHRYKGVGLKSNRVYMVEDLTKHYGVTQNTISNWVGAGLKPSDEERPYVFRGSVVNAFHAERRARKHSQLRPGEFKCVACKLAVFPCVLAGEPHSTKSGAPLLRAICPECAAAVMKIGSASDLAVLSGDLDPNFTGDFIHEGNDNGPGEIGICSEITGSTNDRIIYEWQKYAERHSGKTIDRHLQSIRFFEDCLGCKPFDRLKVEDVANCRDVLKRALAHDGELSLSNSTVRHYVSQIIAFLKWLCQQQGYKRLPSSLPEYLALPKSAYAASLPTQARAYPSIEQARDMMYSMPGQTLIQMRNIAIFALAFLGALRADTLISLRFGDIDVNQKRITQDARRARTKNGKSLVISWFPIPVEFEDAVISWIRQLESAGFGPDDALFPDANTLQHGLTLLKESSRLVATMKSPHAVSQAFKMASATCEQDYTPHSARHTIAHERNVRHLTDEQRRAWSLNMAHENEQITDTHYAKMSDDKRFEVLESIDEENSTGSIDRFLERTDEQIGRALRQLLSSTSSG